MKRFLAASMLILTYIGGVMPQTLPENVKLAIESRDHVRALAELQALRAADDRSFAANNYDYLLARTAESDGQLSAAMEYYQAVASRESVLRPYAFKHLAQIARSTGNLTLERIYLNSILLLSPDSLLANAGADRLARSNFESGNYAETIRILNDGPVKPANGLRQNAKDRSFREDQALLAEAYLRSGLTEPARQIFLNLINNVPNPAQPDDVALTGAKGLDVLDAGADNLGKKAPDLGEGENMRRGNIYQFNRDFESAKLHFETVIANFPTGQNAADAAYQIGRGYTQRGEFVESLKWYERVAERYPESPTAKDALLAAASAYARVGKYKEAIARYQAFIDRFPGDDKLDRAYLNIVDIYRDQRQDSDALKWCAKTEEALKGSTPEAVAIFTQARIYAAREEWDLELKALDRLKNYADLGGATVPGGTGSAEVAFMKAYALEKSKRFAEAIDAYLAIPDGRSEYYGWRATERLNALSGDEAAKPYIAQKTGALATGLKAMDADERRRNAIGILRMSELAEVREKAMAALKSAIKALPRYQNVPAFKPVVETSEQTGQTVGDALLRLGLYDEAAPELDTKPGANADVDFRLAGYYCRGDRGDRGLALIEPLWKKIPADYPIELIHRDQLTMLYPAPYADELLRNAPAKGVNPQLLLAIMRQESRFQPDAKSFAAARGLMQFISTTSVRIAGEVGRGSFRQDDLYYPPTAILLGSQYLADLFKIFPNETDAVVASYNGGDDNVKSWFTRARSNLPERYVPEVVYVQSKDYVYKVMANYRMYQFLYDENLRPR